MLGRVVETVPPPFAHMINSRRLNNKTKDTYVRVPPVLVLQDAPPQYYSSRQTLVGSSCLEQTHAMDDDSQVRKHVCGDSPNKQSLLLTGEKGQRVTIPRLLSTYNHIKCQLMCFFQLNITIQPFSIPIFS